MCGCVNHDERSQMFEGVCPRTHGLRAVCGDMPQAMRSLVCLCTQILGCEVSELVWGVHSIM